MLAVENLDLRYGAAQVLWNLSLTASRGQVTCIMGRNGVGKTSLLRGIVGHQPISGGRILWEGKDIARLAPFERARLGIAYVPQGREIFPLLSVKENLESGYAALKGHSRTIPDEVFELVPGAQDHAVAPRRRSLRRSAAAARDRTRHGDAALADAAR